MTERDDQDGSPLVSIVTPSYNQAEFIRDTIESVRNQTYDDIEHIVVDGASDDGTVDILREYDHLDWISEPDDGESHAVNKGFRRANGDIIAWLNSDDAYLRRDAVSDAVRAFQRTDADVVFGHTASIGADNELLRFLYTPAFSEDRIKSSCFVVHSSVFFRRHVVESEKLDEDRDYTLDFEYWMRLSEDYRWRRIDAVIGADRHYPGRTTRSETEQAIEEGLELLEVRNPKLDVKFWAIQAAEAIAFRVRRLWGIPKLLRLRREDHSEFAIDLERKSVLRTLRTQIFGRNRWVPLRSIPSLSRWNSTEKE